MDAKTKTAPTQPAHPTAPRAMRYATDGADYIGVSRSMAWKIAQTDPDFQAAVSLFKIGAATMALTEDLDRFIELKRAKCAELQSERMARVRAHRVKHDGEFDKAKVSGAATAEKKMPA